MLLIICAGYSVSLPWLTRLKIAVGAAKGLAFLHGEEQPVIYRDFKASNILLDSVIPYRFLWFTSKVYLSYNVDELTQTDGFRRYIW